MEAPRRENTHDEIEPSAVTLPHTPVEDLLGVLTGTFLAAFGLHLLHAAEAVTGGTAGLALLVTYATPLPFAIVYALVNVPFFALAAWKKGWPFTAKSIVAVALVSGFAELHARLLPLTETGLAYAAIAGNLLAGVGLLILFRHGASLGGFNVLALIAQEKLGLRAGYVQMGLDTAVVIAALAVVPLGNVALSAVGAVVLNIVLAFNHRPERYRA
ncbi:YitT family protein [Aeromicrobium sp. PE09-221]|uniref:YitT family protein n=1 Tax=Aeromicrobium sp. PE09-221 TaxID=1898043 RepID=UPI001F1C37A4|nr:YitT family protein [Aeromicrobium sp. PE09-221]